MSSLECYLTATCGLCSQWGISACSGWELLLGPSDVKFWLTLHPSSHPCNICNMLNKLYIMYIYIYINNSFVLNMCQTYGVVDPSWLHNLNFACKIDQKNVMGSWLHQLRFQLLVGWDGLPKLAWPEPSWPDTACYDLTHHTPRDWNPTVIPVGQKTYIRI